MTIIFDKKRNSYISQTTVNGKKKSFRGKTKLEAELKLKKFLDPSGKEAELITLTLKKWALYWFKTYKVNDYKKGTYEKELRRLSNILESSTLGSKRIYEITTSDIQLYINECAETLSPKTIKNRLILLNGAFKQAIREDYIKTNPCEYTSLPKRAKPEMVALTKAEKDLFIEINKDNPYIDIFKFALNTGMRISEICGLQKSDIDYEHKLIIVNKQLVRLKGQLILDSPKTSNSIRKVPLTSEAYNIVLDYAKRSPTDFLFFNPVSKAKLVQNTLSINCHRCMLKVYDATKKEVFLKANFHSFRHTFATQWILQNGNVNLLSKCLGHSDPAFTQRVYVQPSYDDVILEMAKLSF